MRELYSGELPLTSLRTFVAPSGAKRRFQNLCVTSNQDGVRIRVVGHRAVRWWNMWFLPVVYVFEWHAARKIWTRRHAHDLSQIATAKELKILQDMLAEYDLLEDVRDETQDQH